MAKYLLADWERNGYHDSDWFDCYYDDETNKVVTVEVGTTRFAGGPFQNRPKYEPLTDEVLEKARVILQERIYTAIRGAEHREVTEPNKVNKGERVRLLEDHRNKEREETEVPCWKCDGTGEWVNPHNAKDVRKCFGCNGTKTKKRSNAKKGGKFVTYKAGTSGVIVWTGTFRTIYANGYQTLGRHTLSTRVKLDDGTVINVPLSKLRLDREPMGDDELQERARKLSYHYNFLTAGGCTAWGDCPASQYAKQRAKETGQPICPEL